MTDAEFLKQVSVRHSTSGCTTASEGFFTYDELHRLELLAIGAWVPHRLASTDYGRLRVYVLTANEIAFAVSVAERRLINQVKEALTQ